MGSMIHLAVGRLEIDWGKNHIFQDHSPLFQQNEIGDVPYYYVDLDSEDIDEDVGTGPHNLTIDKRINDLKKQLGPDWEHVGGDR